MVRFVCALAALAVVGVWCLASAGPVLPQAWPSKPIRIVAPYPPGGQTDVVACYFAEKLQAVLGQNLEGVDRPCSRLPGGAARGRICGPISAQQGVWSERVARSALA